MPRSFDEYATDEGVHRQGRVSDFFGTRPGLVAEIKAAREFPQAGWDEILEWLQTEHGYPLKSRSSLADYMKAQA